MKVTKAEAVETFPLTVICKACKSHLEIDKSDINYSPDDLSEFGLCMGIDESFELQCPVCEARIGMDSMADRLKRQVRDLHQSPVQSAPSGFFPGAILLFICLLCLAAGLIYSGFQAVINEIH